MQAKVLHRISDSAKVDAFRACRYCAPVLHCHFEDRRKDQLTDIILHLGKPNRIDT